MLKSHCSAPCVNDDDPGFKQQDWLIVRGDSNLLRLTGTEYCLTAGDSPSNGNKVYMQRW